ncbi:MAG: S41 family peptidase [Fimbriimonadales bacterium]
MVKPVIRALLAVPLAAFAVSAVPRISNPRTPAQLPTPQKTPLIGARNLAISPDGKRLAFSYQGDVWVAPAEGGRAIQVTNNIEMDDYPVWSPDGEWIAFSSNRTGNNDIFIAPADGGTTRRLTYHSGADVPSDWSPDGKYILERATRDNPANGVYEIDVNTGQTKQIFLDMAPLGWPKYSPDGKSIFYDRMYEFPWVRPRYHGSGASQLWSYDRATGKREQLLNDEFQHLWPNVTPKTWPVLTVTMSEVTPSSSWIGKTIPKNIDNVNRCPNVYAVDGPGKQRRITNFTEEGPRFLSVAAKADVAAFERDGDVYVMPLGQQPKKIAIYATIDDKTTQEERLILNSGVSNATLSPDGGTWVFSVRNELWSVPTKKGKGPNADDATQLTDWAGVDELPVYTPDGKAIFFVSDRGGAERLYRMDLATKALTAITKVDHDVLETRLTPDKTKVSFWMTGEQGGLYTVPVAGGDPTLVMAVKGNYEADYDWSPDGRYVAYSDTLVGSGYYYWDQGSNIWVLDTTTGQKHDVTQINVQNRAPRWSSDGKYLMFVSMREGGGGGRRGAPAAAPAGAGIYLLPLKLEEAPSEELELKYAKPTTPVKVDIDFNGIELRARRLIGQPADGDYRMDPETGEILFVSGGEIWRASYSGEGGKALTTGGGVASFQFKADGKGLAFVKSGTLATLDLRNPQTPTAITTFRADWLHDLRKEHAAAFNQFWREYNRSFYDPNFHGRDWEALRVRYEKFLPSVGHRNEMATILNELVGELESSHSEVGPAGGNPTGQTSAHPGFLIDYGYDGPGLKVKEVPDHSPGSYAKTKLNPGDIVTQINGKDVRADENLYKDVLNEQTGRDLNMTVKSPDGKTRTVKYRAMSSGQFGGIMAENRIEARRKYVEEKSGGKLTYVHIAGMSGPELSRFNQQVWQYAKDKKGLIIDVRGNGGGNTSDQIIDILERAPNGIYVPRDADPQLGPGQALDKPMVVMMAESSFSNAEMFPNSMKARHLATLVGMPTPGYVIYTGGFPLVDGTNARMPGTGVFRLDGSPQEDMGCQPDFKVDITPEQYFSGVDPQLDKAVEVLMGKVK